MNLKAQNTLLGEIIMATKRHKDKIVPVVACENFIPDDYNLVEFKNIQNSLAFNKPGKTPKLSEINEIFNEDNKYFSGEFRKTAKERYWDTFICDALLGNFDRYANNWGYLGFLVGILGNSITEMKASFLQKSHYKKSNICLRFS